MIYFGNKKSDLTYFWLKRSPRKEASYWLNLVLGYNDKTPCVATKSSHSAHFQQHIPKPQQTINIYLLLTL